MSGEKRRVEKYLRIGVHLANGVVWGPVYGTHLVHAPPAPPPPRSLRGLPAGPAGPETVCDFPTLSEILRSVAFANGVGARMSGTSLPPPPPPAWVKRSVSRTSYRSNVEREARVKSDDGKSP
jgi:hypothetical protein